MPHKSKCPVCGKLKFLHGKTIAEDTTLYWICDDCDRPFEVVFIDKETLGRSKEEKPC